MYLVLTLNNGLPDEMLHIGDDRTKADAEFISALAKRVPNWKSFTGEDVQSALDDGYVEFDGDYARVVCMLDLTNTPGYDAFLVALQPHA